MANTLVYPTHAIVPAIVRRRIRPQFVNTNIPDITVSGIIAGGVPQPVGPVDIGQTRFKNQQAVHAPILYDPNKEYTLSTNDRDIATSTYSVSWNNTLGCITWNSRYFYIKPFCNGVAKAYTLASTVMEENSAARQVVKLTLTFTGSDSRKGVVTTRLFIYPNCSMLRMQHSTTVPEGDISDLGIQIVEAQLTNAKSNLGTDTSGYNADYSGTWDGWVLSNNVLVSLRDAKELYPRGYSIGTTTQTNTSSALFTSCRAWWEFNETSGNRADSFGSNTLVNNAGTWSRITGKVGYGLSPTVAYNEMRVADNSDLSITGDMTISCWVRIDSKANFSVFVSKTDQNTTSLRSYMLYYDSNVDRFKFWVNANASTTTTVVDTVSPVIGQWYHIVVRHNNGANIKIRSSTLTTLGGDTTATHAGGIADTACNFLIGNTSRSGNPDSTGNYYLRGAIDEVIVWARSISDSEVSSLFNGGAGYAFPITTNTGLKIYQHFTNGNRVNAGDYSYANIAKLLYMHQGALNPTLPTEYVTALTSDSAIAAEMTEVSAATTLAADWGGIQSSLDMFIVFCANSNPSDSDISFYHDIHQAGPIVSLVEVTGMKTQYFSEIETAIKRNILSWVGPWKGQWLHGEWRQSDSSLVRVRGCNHYFSVSTSWIHYLRTKDPEILQAARRQSRMFRDVHAREWTGASVNTARGRTHFAHPGALVPWYTTYETNQYHHVDIQALLLGWQVDGDRLCKDKLDMWNPTEWDIGKGRDAANTLVQGQYLKDYQGQDYSALAAERTSVEAAPQDHADAANVDFLWNYQPYWVTPEYMAQQSVLNMIETSQASMHMSVVKGTPEQHYNWLGRVSVDFTRAAKPGPTNPGDLGLGLQWPDFVEDCYRRKIQSFPFAYDMGAYPHKSNGQLEVVFTKPTSADLTFTLKGGSNGGDVNQTTVQYVRPDNTVVSLKAAPNYFPVYPFIPCDHQLLRGGSQETMTITGPAGQYKLRMTGALLLIWGPITPFPEYSVVLAGSVSKFVEGYFKPSAGGAVQFIQESSTLPTESGAAALARFRAWPTAGYFAKYAEWLP